MDDAARDNVDLELRRLAEINLKREQVEGDHGHHRDLFRQIIEQRTEDRDARGTRLRKAIASQRDVIAVAERRVINLQNALDDLDSWEPEEIEPIAPASQTNHITLQDETLARKRGQIAVWQIRERFIEIYNTLPYGANDRRREAFGQLVEGYFGPIAAIEMLAKSEKGSPDELSALYEMHAEEFMMLYLMDDFIKSQDRKKYPVYVYTLDFRPFVDSFSFTTKRQAEFVEFSQRKILPFAQKRMIPDINKLVDGGTIRTVRADDIPLPFEIGNNPKRDAERFTRWKAAVLSSIDAIERNAEGVSPTILTLFRAVNGCDPEQPRRAIITLLETTECNGQTYLGGYVYAVDQSIAEQLISQNLARAVLIEELATNLDRLEIDGAVPAWNEKFEKVNPTDLETWRNEAWSD